MEREREHKRESESTIDVRLIPHHFGLEGGLDLSVVEPVPVDAAEEGLLFDVPLPLRPTAQTLGRVLGHQLSVCVCVC